MRLKPKSPHASTRPATPVLPISTPGFRHSHPSATCPRLACSSSVPGVCEFRWNSVGGAQTRHSHRPSHHSAAARRTPQMPRIRSERPHAVSTGPAPPVVHPGFPDSRTPKRPYERTAWLRSLKIPSVAQLIHVDAPHVDRTLRSVNPPTIAAIKPLGARVTGQNPQYGNLVSARSQTGATLLDHRAAQLLSPPLRGDVQRTQFAATLNIRVALRRPQNAMNSRPRPRVSRGHRVTPPSSSDLGPLGDVLKIAVGARSGLRRDEEVFLKRSRLLVGAET